MLLNTDLYATNFLTPVLIFISAFNFFVFLLAVKKGRQKQYRYFSVFIFSLWAYSTGYLMQVHALALDLKVFWANIKVTAALFAPIIWFMASYSAIYHRRPSAWVVLAMGAVSLANAIVLWNDGAWQIYRHSVELVKVSHQFYLMKPTFGMWFYTIYAWSIIVPFINSGVLLFRAFTLAKRGAKVQYGLLLAIILALVFGMLPSSMNLIVLDGAAFATVFMCFFYLILISKYRFADVASLARDAVMDTVHAVILIYNIKGELVEHNTEDRDRPIKDLPAQSFHILCESLGLDVKGDIFNRPVTVSPLVNGKKRWLSIHIRELVEEGSEVCGYLVYIRDVTEENTLMVLEKEKEKLAQKKLIIGDIHDGISSSLTVIGMLAAQRPDDRQGSADILGKINKIASHALKELRLMMNSYDNEDLPLGDISADLRYTGNLFAADTGFAYTHTADLKAGEDYILPFPVYINLIRFFKECIVNSIKHSGGDVVSSHMAFDGTTLSITVRDNGKGLCEDENRGFGLASMRRRTKKLGGEICLASRNGTSITLTLPLTQPA